MKDIFSTVVSIWYIRCICKGRYSIQCIMFVYV